MDNSGVVFIPQEAPVGYRDNVATTKDLSSAARYGRLHPILSMNERASMTPGPCLFKLSKELRDFDPANDFVCYAGGDPMSLALAFMVLKDLGLREVRFLRWERERDTKGKRTAGGFYVPVKIKLFF
jgi:hypothetical protein